MAESHSIPSLLCTENESCLDEEIGEDAFIDMRNYSVSEEEDEYVRMLLDRELNSGLRKDESLASDKWTQCARLEAINWVLNKRAIFGFGFQTAYLSVTYFDQFISKRAINKNSLWAMRLLPVACLSLAAKMEESKVPKLPKFEVEDFEFESRVIRRMELLLLNTIEWRMASITPFAFLPYFITKFSNESPPNALVSKTVKLILAIMKEINLVNHRPSGIAAAAILMASEGMLSRQDLECRMKPIFCNCNLDIEDTFTCYNLLQKLGMKELKISNLLNSPDMSPGQLRPVINVSENSSVTSAASNKRKRLSFDDYDQDDGTPVEKRGR